MVTVLVLDKDCVRASVAADSTMCMLSPSPIAGCIEPASLVSIDANIVDVSDVIALTSDVEVTSASETMLDVSDIAMA